MRRTTLASCATFLMLASGALAAPSPLFGGDVGQYRQRPQSIHLTSDLNVRKIHWSSWGGPVALGRATVYESAANHVPPAPVRLSLSGLTTCGKRRLYLKLKLTYGPTAPAVIRYTCRSPR